MCHRDEVRFVLQVGRHRRGNWVRKWHGLWHGLAVCFELATRPGWCWCRCVCVAGRLVRFLVQTGFGLRRVDASCTRIFQSIRVVCSSCTGMKSAMCCWRYSAFHVLGHRNCKCGALVRISMAEGSCWRPNKHQTQSGPNDAYRRALLSY